MVGDIGGSAAQGATIIAHEEVLNRMSATPAGNEAPALLRRFADRHLRGD